MPKHDPVSEDVPFWTIATLAEHWQVSQVTVRRAIARGELKAIRLPGRAIRIHPREAQRACKPVTTAATLLGDAA